MQLPASDGRLLALTASRGEIAYTGSKMAPADKTLPTALSGS